MKKLLMLIIFFSIFIPYTSGVTIPPNQWKFDEDYFTVLGGPEMVVSTIGSPEYERGESSTVLIQIMNQGKILGFESEDEPADDNEIDLSEMERQKEYDVTTAVGVVVSISALDAPVDIKTSPQSAGSLLTGQVSSPLQFEIRTWDSARGGTYLLQVDLTYQYQKDVQVEGDTLKNQIDYHMLYQEVNESHKISIEIKEQADFEVVEVTGDLLPGSSDILNIDFKNIGEETASKSTARLRLSDPLSSTDHTSFLGDVGPGDEVRARFKIDVDPDATAKVYPVKAEIEYEDSEGLTRISDIIYVPVSVIEPQSRGGIFQNLYFLGGSLVVLAALIYFFMKRRSGGMGREK